MVNQPPSHAASAKRFMTRQGVRVLMVVDGRYPATGGAEMQARLLARALSEAGHAVRVLAPLLEPTAATREHVDGVEVIRLAYPRWRGLGAVVLNLRFASWLLRHQREYDAIHIHMMHNLAGAAGWLQPLLKPRLVVKVSGAAEFQGGILDPARRSAWKHRVLGAGARRLDAFQCISAHTARVLGEAGYPAQRLWRVPNAVQVARFQPAQPERTSDVRVVFVGRHVAVKGLDVLLRAWSLLPIPRGARLVLAGDGPESPRLRALARELGVAREVDFPGVVDDVPALLRGASLYVQPSHSEGLPNAVLEAMAAGLPVVATRISGHEDVLSHGLNGLLVPAGDAPAMATALKRLLGDAAMRERMGAQGREHMLREFDVPVVLRRLVCLYTEGFVPPAETPTDSEPA